MKSLSSKTYQCGVTIQGLTTLSGTVYLTGITNTASWDHVIVGTTAQGQIYTRTYAQFMGDVATGISLSSYVTGSGTTNYLSKFTGGSALGNSQIFDNGTNVGIGTASPAQKLHIKRTETVNRTTYTDILTIDADANNSPYTGHGGGILFRGTTYSGSANNVQGNRIWGRIGMFLNDFYDGFNGESMFFAVAPDDRSDALSTAMTIQYNGNVGIGTTSPTVKLHVWNGGIKTTGFPSMGNPFTFLESNYNDAAVTVRFQNINPANGLDADLGIQLMNTGGSMADVLRIKGATGNLGIGTTSPGYKLDVSGDINFSGTLKFGGVTVFSNSGADVYANIRVIRNESTSLSDGMYIGYNNSGGTSGHLRFFANGTTERMRIDASNGNIGIGTSSPAQKLDVAGGDIILSSNATYIRSKDASGNTPRMFGINPSNDTYIGPIDPYAGGAVFYGVSANVASQTFYTGATARLHITSGGNVGIGTTTPLNLLHVSQPSANTIFRLGNNASYDQFIYFNGGNDWSLGMDYSNSNAFVLSNASSIGTNDRLVVTTGGNVGIGTTSPTFPLSVQGIAQARGGVYITQTSPTNTLILNADDTALHKIYTNASVDLSLGTNSSTSQLYLKSGGNVGIGTDSPSNKLHIRQTGIVDNTATTLLLIDGQFQDSSVEEADIVSIGFRIENSTGGSQTSQAISFAYNNILSLMKDGGNVGIGTTTPSTKLDVSGVITATGGNSTNWNTAYGWGNHASASYVPQARTLTINGTSYDLSANRTWTIATSANIQEAANNGKVTTAASVGTTVITTVATATYDGATFNYVLKDGTNYRAGTIIAVWSAGAVQFNETTTNDIGSTVGVTFAVALNAGNAELRATSATSGWTVKVVTIGI